MFGVAGKWRCENPVGRFPPILLFQNILFISLLVRNNNIGPTWSFLLQFCIYVCDQTAPVRCWLSTRGEEMCIIVLLLGIREVKHVVDKIRTVCYVMEPGVFCRHGEGVNRTQSEEVWLYQKRGNAW